MLRVHVNADIMVFPPRLLEKLECQSRRNIWHKYHDWYFKIVIRNLIWDDFEISRVVLMPNITYKSCYYLFIPLPAKGFVIFTCSYFKLSWNTAALSQSNCRNFSCSSIISQTPLFSNTHLIWTPHYYRQFSWSLGKESYYIFS